VYFPTLLPTAVPTSVLWRQCIPPHTRVAFLGTDFFEALLQR
jgi:hypothetical protein